MHLDSNDSTHRGQGDAVPLSETFKLGIQSSESLPALLEFVYLMYVIFKSRIQVWLTS